MVLPITRIAPRYIYTTRVVNVLKKNIFLYCSSVTKEKVDIKHQILFFQFGRHIISLIVERVKF